MTEDSAASRDALEKQVTSGLLGATCEDAAALLQAKVVRSEATPQAFSAAWQ